MNKTPFEPLRPQKNLNGTQQWKCPIHKCWTAKPIPPETERFCAKCDLERRQKEAALAKNAPPKPTIKIGSI